MNSRFIFLITLIFPALSFGSGSSVRGGGDEVALDFQKSFAQALLNISSSLPSLEVSVEAAHLAQIASQANVIVVDSPLGVDVDGVEQFSIAENDPSHLLIMINRSRWTTIADLHLKEAVALHEIASLAGLEHTGFYPLSSVYLGGYGLKADALAPLSVPCQAPASEGSTCVKQRPDYVTQLFVVKHFGVYVDAKGNAASQTETYTGRHILFYDESKIYEFQIVDMSPGANGQVGALTVTDGQVAGATNQTLDQSRALSFYRDQGKVSSSLVNTSFLETTSAGGNTSFTPFPDTGDASKIIASNTSDTTDASGVEIKINSSGNLNIDFGGGYHEQSQTITYVYKPWDLDSFEKTLKPRAQNSLNNFIGAHTSVLAIKKNLNLCLRAKKVDCTDLREQFEKADQARDALFFNLVSNSDFTSNEEPAPNTSLPPRHQPTRHSSKPQPLPSRPVTLQTGGAHQSQAPAPHLQY